MTIDVEGDLVTGGRVFTHHHESTRRGLIISVDVVEVVLNLAVIAVAVLDAHPETRGRVFNATVTAHYHRVVFVRARLVGDKSGVGVLTRMAQFGRTPSGQTFAVRPPLADDVVDVEPLAVGSGLILDTRTIHGRKIFVPHEDLVDFGQPFKRSVVRFG